MQNFFDGNQGAIVCIGSFYISDMKKSRPIKSYVNKGALHAWKNTDHFS